MPAILRKLPFYDRFSTVEVYGQALRVFPYQILVWVSLGPGGAPPSSAHTAFSRRSRPRVYRQLSPPPATTPRLRRLRTGTPLRMACSLGDDCSAASQASRRAEDFSRALFSDASRRASRLPAVQRRTSSFNLWPKMPRSHLASKVDGGLRPGQKFADPRRPIEL